MHQRLSQPSWYVKLFARHHTRVLPSNGGNAGPLTRTADSFWTRPRRRSVTRRSDGPKGPKFVQYFAPIIEALKALGGSARPAEATDWVAAKLGIADDERSELTTTGVVRFDNAVAWARFYLARAAIIDASKRGVWTLT